MKWRDFLVLALVLVCSVTLVSADSQSATMISSFGSIQIAAYLSALDASKLQIAKIYPGGGSVLAFIEYSMGTISAKRSILEYAVNRMHTNAVMIMWRRLPVSWDMRDQLESPLNSGNLNPSYIRHLDEWVSLAKEYNVHIIFEEWFDPMQAQGNGEWTGFDDWAFHAHRANFYKVLAAHFKGNTSIAGFIPGEDAVYPEPYPWPTSGSASFNSLWNSVMTNLSIALHEGDPNFNFIAQPTLDWDGGGFTLGSKAMYPNAWQPLLDPNAHVLYRVMWNPANMIKSNVTNSYYPFNRALFNGAVNWHRETGLPITIECLVEWRAEEAGGVWVWDNQAFQWMRDFLVAMKNEGIGLNVGEYWNGSEPYTTHDKLGNERTWVQVYSDAVVS